MFLTFMIINYYALVINLVSLLSHTFVKDLFTILLIVSLKKANVVEM